MLMDCHGVVEVKLRKNITIVPAVRALIAGNFNKQIRRFSKPRARCLVLLALSAPVAVGAATQGQTGGSSTGILNVLVGIGDSVRISNLQDISGAFNGVDDIFGTSPACVYRNATGIYSIKGLGSGQNGQFMVSDGANQVPFSVTYDDGTGAQELLPGTDLKGRTGADRFSTTCANTGNNGAIAIGISATDLARVPAGNYVGTLALIVCPE